MKGINLNPKSPINNPSAVLIRLVRMTFHPDALADFLDLFDASAPQIRAFPGCHHLDLWQDAHYPNILTTYSHWDDADALNRYRHSDLFQTTWAKTRPLFAAPPWARSQQVLRAIQEQDE